LQLEVAAARKDASMKEIELQDWKRRYMELKNNYRNEFKRITEQLSDEEGATGTKSSRPTRSANR